MFCKKTKKNIDDIAAYFEENNINIDGESNLNQTIESKNENVQQDVELLSASDVTVTLANSLHTDNITATANNILLEKNHYVLKYNTITFNIISH